MGDEFGQSLVDIVGGRNVAVGEAIPERYRLDLTRKFGSRPAWLVKPASTAELSAILRNARLAKVAVTVIGGQSGGCGAAVPSDGSLALSLERMDRTRRSTSMTMAVEAGCILQIAQERAEAQGAFLPLDLGARGSAA